MMDVLNSEHSRIEKKQCTICHRFLPLNGAFCHYCAILKEREMFPDSILSLGQTFVRIGFLIILFVGFVGYRMDLSLDRIVQKQLSADGPISVAGQLEQENLRVIHFINAGMVNVRAEPSIKSSILMVLRRGQQIVVQDRRDRWAKISIDNKIGWVSNKLIDSKVR